MEIKLRTDRFCIETEAKRVYEKLLKLYFDKGNNEETRLDLEGKIEGLKIFLEETDTKTLRSFYPELDKGGEADVILRVDPVNREMVLVFNEKEVDPPRKAMATKGKMGS